MSFTSHFAVGQALLTDTTTSASSVLLGDPKNLVDGFKSTPLITRVEAAPWLTIEMMQPITVKTVVIYTDSKSTW